MESSLFTWPDLTGFCSIQDILLLLAPNAFAINRPCEYPCAEEPIHSLFTVQLAFALGVLPNSS